MPDDRATPPDTERWFVYVLACAGDRLYCGIAKDVQARFAEHIAGRGARFTRSFRPASVLVTRVFDSRSAALRAEHAFKALSRASKRQRIAAWQASEAQ